ncbi:hypothetical protein J1G35_20405 [Pseudomonas sp. SH10-3B]|uniref:hypothetical protein n=1 Tax=Pseudomonas sp. SH10-3B TaxID=2816049 RepID=UPI001CA707D2|nr:hypothetical protein [Pseudomonas sp. SH10-3B]MBY8948225.1 hypothetical protein [Pseudomonas sp. SH10-3B]
MPGQNTRVNNLMRNGSFSRYGAEWTTLNTVDYSRQYCRVLNGQTSQVISAGAETTYLLKFWSQVLFKGRGELLIQADQPSVGARLDLNDFHLWTRRQISFTTPPATTNITVSVIGTEGEVCVDELNLILDTSTVPTPELVLNGDFSANSTHWDTTGSPGGSRAHFDGNTFEASLNGRARQTIAVTGGNTYELSFRTQVLFGGHGFFRFELAPSGVFPEIRVDASDWTSHTREFVMPAGTTALTVLMIGIDGAVFFDDVSLKRKP